MLKRREGRRSVVIFLRIPNGIVKGLVALCCNELKMTDLAAAQLSYNELLVALAIRCAANSQEQGAKIPTLSFLRSKNDTNKGSMTSIFTKNGTLL